MNRIRMNGQHLGHLSLTQTATRQASLVKLGISLHYTITIFGASLNGSSEVL